MNFCSILFAYLKELFYNDNGVIKMYDYIKGIVTGIKNNAIVLDNNGVGYFIYVPDNSPLRRVNFYLVINMMMQECSC